MEKIFSVGVIKDEQYIEILQDQLKEMLKDGEVLVCLGPNTDENRGCAVDIMIDCWIEERNRNKARRTNRRRRRYPKQ